MYDSIVDVYDDIFVAKDYELEAKQILKMVNVNPGLRLIDIGCGTGSHSSFFESKISYTGIDISDVMIEKAKQKNKKSMFYAIKLSEFVSLVDNKYDIATSLFNVINHIMSLDDLINFFINTRECLNPDSAFIFDTWNGYASILDQPKEERRDYDGNTLFLKPSFDAFNQSVNVHYSFESKTGEVIWANSLNMTVWTPKVIKDCLKIAGFNHIEIFSGFGKNTKVKPAIPEDYKLLFFCKPVLE